MRQKARWLYTTKRLPFCIFNVVIIGGVLFYPKCERLNQSFMFFNVNSNHHFLPISHHHHAAIAHAVKVNRLSLRSSSVRVCVRVFTRVKRTIDKLLPRMRSKTCFTHSSN